MNFRMVTRKFLFTGSELLEYINLSRIPSISWRKCIILSRKFSFFQFFLPLLFLRLNQKKLMSFFRKRACCVMSSMLSYSSLVIIPKQFIDLNRNRLLVRAKEDGKSYYSGKRFCQGKVQSPTLKTNHLAQFFSPPIRYTSHSSYVFFFNLNISRFIKRPCFRAFVPLMKRTIDIN